MGEVVVGRLQQQSEVSASGLVSQGFGLALLDHPNPMQRQEQEWTWVLPLQWHRIYSGREALGSTTQAVHPRPFLPPESCL